MNNLINNELLLKQIDDLKLLQNNLLFEIENKINSNLWTIEWLEQTEDSSDKTSSILNLELTSFDQMSVLMETIYLN
jgi:hypothetical protein